MTISNSPNLPYPPGDWWNPPAQPRPSVFDGFLPKRATRMDIWMIWVTDTDPDSEIWLLEAWDDDSIQSNHEGWDDKVKEAFETYGGEFVRITKTSVDFDKVRAAFEPMEV